MVVVVVVNRNETGLMTVTYSVHVLIDMYLINTLLYGSLPLSLPLSFTLTYIYSMLCNQQSKVKNIIICSNITLSV